MNVLNAEKATCYLDFEHDSRKRSAAIAIHCAWLRHSSSLSTKNRLSSTSPLDMLVLYQAAVDVFQQLPSQSRHRAEELSQGSHVVNWQQASDLLRAVPDQETLALATRFANRVIALSVASASKQDLKYYVELFLRCVQDKRIVDNIMTGDIAAHSDRLSDPDYWP